MMKKALITALLVALGTLGLRGQHYVGLKGGYGAAHGRFYVKPKRSDLTMGRYTGGVAWRYFSPLPVVGGIGAELEYPMRGYHIYRVEDNSTPISDTTSYTESRRTVSTLTLPLLWQPHLYLVNRHVRVSIVGGVTLSYNTGIGDRLTTTEYVWNGGTRTQTATETVTEYRMRPARDVRWNYGWLAGAAIDVLAGRWAFSLEGRYYYGMSDILRNRTKYQLHDDRYEEWRPIRSELDNIYVTFGVYYRLGKGGIQSPPLRRRGGPKPSGGDFRNIRVNR